MDKFDWPKYVPIAKRKQKAAKYIQSSQKKGKQFNPVVIEGRTIAKTFWGKAWCDNLKTYSDYENRLPRGQTYVRNGSVIDLKVSKGLVMAQVMGSSLYHIVIEFKPMLQRQWEKLIEECSGKIDSLIELLQGKFSKSVMKIITEKTNGLFPNPKQIKMQCSCPDSAGMCKHIAAVLYGVGAMIDSKPEWLFDLRHVNHTDLISSANTGAALWQNENGNNFVADTELSNLFGIEIDQTTRSLKPKKKTKALASTGKTLRKNPTKQDSPLRKKQKNI